MKLDKIYKKSSKITFDDNTKIIIMSDCHRGNGNTDDNFLQNENIYQAALKYYYKNDFTYIELGDGDEMWEVKNYTDIVKEHYDTFKEIKKFHDKNKLIMIFGNHDIDKNNPEIFEKTFSYSTNPVTKEKEPLFKDLKIYESLILDYKSNDIFLVHGHQVDFLSGTLPNLSRFLVRYVWNFFEKFGIKDPTSAAKNYKVSKKIEKKLQKWSINNNKIIIAGHTHRPIFPKVGQSLYFNDGSCIHPNGITCIEIENGKITLVKWEYKLSNDKYITVGRSFIDGNIPIISFFK